MTRSSRALPAILVAGSAAGALDLAFAIGLTLAYGGVPSRMLQGIASGLLGAAAFEGGAATAALGVLCHFTIATGAAALFYAASRRLRDLVERPWLAGSLFGIAAYLVMNLVVVPLSAAAYRPKSAELIGILVAGHVLFVGLPIAFTVRRFERR